MTGFFKKKRQSTAAKKQQQPQLANGADIEAPRNTSSSSSQKSHILTNPNSSPNLNVNSQFVNHASPQNKYYTQSPNPQMRNQYSSGQMQPHAQNQVQSQPQHYSTANIPPQSTFQNMNYQQQQQAYSKSATPPYASHFGNSPQGFGQPPIQQQNLYRQQHQFASPQQPDNQQYLQQQQSQKHQHQQYNQHQHQHQHQHQQYQQRPQQEQSQQQFTQSYTPARLESSSSKQASLPEQLIQKDAQSKDVTRTPPQNFARKNIVSPSSPSSASVISKPQPWRRKKLFNSPFPRYRHTASTITADNGCLFVMGGLRDDNVYGDIWLITPIGSDVTANYSYIAKPIETTEGVPAPRVCHNSILIGNAFIVYGGDTIKLNAEGELDNNLYFFNINSMKWTTPSPRGQKPSGRYGHTITVVTFQNNNEEEVSSWSSYLYLFGGQLDEEKFNDMWCFDLSNFRRPTTQWRKIYSNDAKSQYQPPPLSNHTMTVYDGRIYVYGGSAIGGELSNALYCFNPVDESWSACPYTSAYQAPAVEEHSSILYQNLLISYGGKDSVGATISDFTVINLDTFQVYKIETPFSSNSPGRRAGHSLTYDMKNEKLLVMGGDQLNLESINSSRDDVVFDGLVSGDNNDELLQLTSIDPASLEYETTFVYEFDLAYLEAFLNKSPDPNPNPKLTTPRENKRVSSGEKTSPVSEKALEPINNQTPVYQDEILNRSTQSSLDHLDDREVASSTPLKNDADTSNSAANSTAGSIKLARKVSISSHANQKTHNMPNVTSSVKRVDSINVHRNRRIKSADSYNDDRVEIVNSSRNVTPVLKQVAQTESRDGSFAQPSDISHEDFRTPLGSSLSVAEPQAPSFVEAEASRFAPYQKVGSKVDLQMDSDDDEENESVPPYKDPNNSHKTIVNRGDPYAEASRNLTDKANGYESPQEAISSSSSFPNPKEKNNKVSIPSAISDTTMNSFLDSYTNKAGSYDQYSSREQLHHTSSSSLAFSSNDELHQDDTTPLVTNNGHFEESASNDLSTPPSSNSGRQNETIPFEKDDDPQPSFNNHSTNDQLSATPEFSTRSKSNNPFEVDNMNTSGEREVHPDFSENGRIENIQEQPKNLEMSQLYDRLNDLKRSLNEKMIFANDKIVGLEQEIYHQKQESESLSAKLAEKEATIESLSQNHSAIVDDHAVKVEKLNNLVSTHERSIGANVSALEAAQSQIKEKDIEIANLKSTHSETQSKLSQYEILLNDRLLNLNKFNKVLQKQKEFVQQQQMKHLEKEEMMLKRINELTLENENIKVECNKYKKMRDISNSVSLDEDELTQESKSRKASSAYGSGDPNSSVDESDFNDTSISELSQGLDKLISTIRSVSNGAQGNTV